MNKRHYEHTLPNIRGSLSNTYDKITIFVLKYSDYEKVVIDSHVLSPFVSLLLCEGGRYGWRKQG